MEYSVKEQIIDLLENKVQKCRVMVLGDIMLDRYFYGNVTRISPEAPVPINTINLKKDTLGGAANVAYNLSKMGSQVFLLGAIGDDHHGRLLIRELKKQRINTDGVILGREKTTTKVRVLGGHQQMMRLDFEETDCIDEDVEYRIKSFVDAQLATGMNAIIISDYGKGMCTTSICQYVIEQANKEDVPIMVDPKGNIWEKYSGATYITPNVKELSEVVGRKLSNSTDVLRDGAMQIKNKHSLASVMVTRSEKGISLFGKDEITIPTVAQEVFDVSGAGDTVIAGFSIAYGSGLSEKTAMEFANFAAGIEVGKVGTYAVSKKDILNAL